MANVRGQGIKCLGCHMDPESYSNEKLLEVWYKAYNKKKATVLDKPHPPVSGPEKQGTVDVLDLPIKLLDMRPTCNVM